MSDPIFFYWIHCVVFIALDNIVMKRLDRDSIDSLEDPPPEPQNTGRIKVINKELLSLVTSAPTPPPPQHYIQPKDSLNLSEDEYQYVSSDVEDELPEMASRLDIAAPLPSISPARTALSKTSAARIGTSSVASDG